MRSIRVFAGDVALKHIQQNGLQPTDIRIVLSAAGGPKWLSLAALDQYLFKEWLMPAQHKISLIGTSAGAWRLAAATQSDPIAAHKRLLDGYLSQDYKTDTKPNEVALNCRAILKNMLGQEGAQQLVNHPRLHFHTIAARCKLLTKFENPMIQTVGFAAAMGANALHRAAMRPWLQRVFFHHHHALNIPFNRSFKTHNVQLTEENVEAALAATGAIPIAVAGVEDIPGAPPGMYRDGGLIDYHLDLPIHPKNGLVLFPHYFAAPPKPGWFDKRLKWRKAARKNFSHTVMIAPSWEFAQTLPNGRIPDLEDFYNMQDYKTRRAVWDTAVKECQRIADDVSLIHDQERWQEIVEPLPW